MDQRRGNDAAQANMPDLMAELLKALEKARDDFIKARVDEKDSKQVANLKWEEFVRSWFTSGDNHTPCVISDWHGKDRHCLFLVKFFTAL